MRSFRPLALLVAVTAALVACGPIRPVEPTDVPTVDSGRTDGSMDGVGADSPLDSPMVTGERCFNDSECDDMVYCNGRERCAGGVCARGTAPCDDTAECTTNMCDEDNDRCVINADDSMCGDRNACNGVERCNPRAVGADPRTGCTPVRREAVIDCDDGNNCTIDSCDSTAGCVHSPRDLDGDGFVDRTCTDNGLPSGTPGTDCNDGDPLVYPGAVEDCYDGRDNNCNNLADFFDTAAMCRAVAHDTCASPRLLPGPGTYNVSLVGTTNDHNLSCNTVAANDVVYRFRLDAPQDVRVSLASTEAGSAIAVSNNCNPMMFMERSCGRVTTAGGMTAAPSIFLRALPAGEYFLILEATGSSPYRFSLRFDPPTMFPAGDACPPASPMATLALGASMPGAPSAVMPGMLADDFSLSCNPGLPRPDGVLTFTLTERRNVDLTVSSAAGVNYVSVRRRGGAMGSCPGSQLRCQATPSSAPFVIGMRDLEPDTYYVVVENSVDTPITVTAASSDPSMRAPGDACRTAIPIAISAARPTTVMATVNFQPFLVDNDHGVAASCGSRNMPSGWRDGVFSFTLDAETDTRIIVRPIGGWAPSYFWSVQSTCGNTGTVVGTCKSTTGSAQQFFTGLAAGTYGIVVETQAIAAAGQGFEAVIEARSPASRARSEACSGEPITLSPMGANLVGSVTFNPETLSLNPNPDHGTSCGSDAAPGFTDLVYSFTIPDSRMVSVSLSPTSPGIYWFELQDRCGTRTPARCRDAFPGAPVPLSTRLAAGTYFIVAETVSSGRRAATINITATP